MKQKLSILAGLVLMLSSLGCIVEHRDDEYRRHREFREHEERDGGRYYHEGDGGRWERRDFDDPWR